MKDTTQSNAKRTLIKDFAMWVTVALLVSAAVGTNYYYRNVALPLRLIGWLVLFCVTLFIALQTSTGQRVWQFAIDARAELRKVVWRSRQETLRLTLIVAVIVAITSLILWGMDGMLLWVVGWLTGQRG